LQVINNIADLIEKRARLAFRAVTRRVYQHLQAISDYLLIPSAFFIYDKTVFNKNQYEKQIFFI